MRLSSIVSLVVVTASLALGGCAGDAEPASGGGTDNPNVVLSDPTQKVDQGGRTGDLRLIGRVTDEWQQPSDETRARQVETHTGGVADPRIDVFPSGFNAALTEKVVVTPPAFQYVNTNEVGVTTDLPYRPFSDTSKDVP
jgi:hypothetical protein